MSRITVWTCDECGDRFEGDERPHWIGLSFPHKFTPKVDLDFCSRGCAANWAEAWVRKLKEHASASH